MSVAIKAEHWRSLARCMIFQYGCSSRSTVGYCICTPENKVKGLLPTVALHGGAIMFRKPC